MRRLGRDQPHRRRQPRVARSRRFALSDRVRRLRPRSSRSEPPVGAPRPGAGDPRALRDRRAEAAGMSPRAQTAKRIGRGTRKPENWVQLLQFGLVGASGYFVNLFVFAISVGPIGVHYIPAAVIAFCVAALGITLIALELLVQAGMPDLPGQAIAIAIAMPFNFIGNKLWTFDSLD